jgi:hypothetical protein
MFLRQQQYNETEIAAIMTQFRITHKNYVDSLSVNGLDRLAANLLNGTTSAIDTTSSNN